MVKDLLVEFDKVALRVMQENNQPISAGIDVAYEAGRRIGTLAGIQRAKQAIVDWYSRDTQLEKSL
jgi:hypothetical protein